MCGERDYKMKKQEQRGAFRNKKEKEDEDVDENGEKEEEKEGNELMWLLVVLAGCHSNQVPFLLSPPSLTPPPPPLLYPLSS